MTLASGGQKIEVRHLTKRYGSTLAVDDLSFDVNPGGVTGFIGPNGSGKTTTMRLILGLDCPTGGEVTVGGKHYRDLLAPLREVGALLDAKAVHPSRTAFNYLLALAQSNAIPASRVDEVLGMVGMEGVAGKRVGGFSLGMGQRLGIAAALLGDPPVLMFDEPLNGLDPEGIVWIRQFMQHLAGEGRTVFVSSHLMNEMAVTADHLIVIGQGKLLRDEGMNEFVESSSQLWVLVRSPQLIELSSQLEAAGATVKSGPEGSIEVAGIDCNGIGDLASARGLTLVEVIAFVAFIIGQALISGHAPTANLGQAGVVRALIGAGLDGALLGMMGLAFGIIIRNAAGAIAVLVAILYVLPGIAAALPTTIEHTVQEYWPTQAGGQITTVVGTSNTLSPWAGFGVFLLFVAILSVIAFTLLNRRDA